MPIRIELCNPKHLWVRDAAEHDFRIVARCKELLHHRTDSPLQDIVTEVHTKKIVADKRLRAKDGVRDSGGRTLNDVRHLNAICPPVAEELLHFLRQDVPEDYTDVRDARVAEVLEAV